MVEPRKTMDINSESNSEDEVEVTEQASVEKEQEGQDEAQQTSAAHPTNEETTTSLARECGTPGCDLADGHLELCKTQQVTGPRQRRPPVSVQTGQAKAAEEAEEAREAEEVGEVEEEQQQQQQEEEEEEQEVRGAAHGQTEAAEAAVRQAEAEGLTLQPANNAVGYRGVARHGGTYQARVSRAGKEVHIGCFATAEEAALAYARTPETQAWARAQATKPAPLTAGEAVAQAAAEGLKLESSNKAASGYKGVSAARSDSGLYQAHAYLKGAGKNVFLGSFVTAEEAALAVARAGAQTGPPAASPAAPKRRAARLQSRRPQSGLATAWRLATCNPFHYVSRSRPTPPQHYKRPWRRRPLPRLPPPASRTS